MTPPPGTFPKICPFEEVGIPKMGVVKEQFEKLPKGNQLIQKILTQINKKGLQVTKDVKLKKFRMFLHFAGDDIA